MYLVNYCKKAKFILTQAPYPPQQASMPYPPQQAYPQQAYPPTQQAYPPTQQAYPPTQPFPPMQQQMATAAAANSLLKNNTNTYDYMGSDEPMPGMGGFDDKAIRRGFIRKVPYYAHISSTKPD